MSAHVIISLDTNNLDMAVDPQTLDFYAINTNERAFAPRKSAEFNFAYRRLDFLIHKPTIGTNNNALARNAELRRQFYTERNAQNNRGKTQNIQEARNIDNEDISDPESPGISLMPCNRTNFMRNKRRLPGGGVEVPKLNYSRSPSEHRVKMENRALTDRSHSNNQNQRKSEPNNGPIVQMINRYIKNDHYNTLLEIEEKSDVMSGSTNSRGQTKQQKPNDTPFFMTAVAGGRDSKRLNNPRRYESPIKIKTVNTSPLKSLPTSRYMRNASPVPSNASSFTIQQPINKMKSVSNRVYPRPTQRHETVTLSRLNKINEKRTKPDPKPQARPMRYNMSRNDYSRSHESSSSKDSRGASTKRNQNSLKDATPRKAGIDRPHRSQTHRIEHNNSSGSSSDSYRSYGRYNNSRSPVMASSEVSSPFLRSYDSRRNARKILTNSPWPSYQTKLKDIEDMKVQNMARLQPQHKSPIKSTITSHLLGPLNIQDHANRVTTVTVNRYTDPGEEILKSNSNTSPNNRPYLSGLRASE